MERIWDTQQFTGLDSEKPTTIPGTSTPITSGSTYWAYDTKTAYIYADSD